MKKKFSIIVACIVVAACAVAHFAPSETALPAMQQKVPGITYQQVKDGYALYESKCANCHHLYNPADYTTGQWNVILQRMISKARITDTLQRKLIVDYIHAASK